MFLAISLTDPLMLVILALGAIILLVAVAACIVNFLVYFRYFVYNKKNSADQSGFEAARQMLDNLGMTEYNVQKCGFFRMMIFGNSYSPGKKTIFLRGSIMNTRSITAVAMACQKVGLAVLHHNNDKQFISRYKLMFITVIGPHTILPLLIIGLALDLIVFFSGSLIFTLVALFAGLALFICSGVFTFLQIPVEKNAVKIAEKTMIDFNMLDQAQLVKVRKIYSVYILNFILAFIMQILQAIRVILQIVYVFAGDK